MYNNGYFKTFLLHCDNYFVECKITWRTWNTFPSLFLESRQPVNCRDRHASMSSLILSLFSTTLQVARLQHRWQDSWWIWSSWWEENQKYTEKSCFSAIFVHLKSHMSWSWNFMWGHTYRPVDNVCHIASNTRINMAMMRNTLSYIRQNKPMEGFRFSAVVTKSSIFWDVILGRPVEVNRRFGGTCRLRLHSWWILVWCTLQRWRGNEEI
jgi:hypothetical protein